MYISNKINKNHYVLSSDLDINNKSFIYGEVNHEDLLNLINNLSIDITNYHFLDIGSGAGKICIYVNMKLNLLSTGVEIDINRYNDSIILSENMNLDNIYFINDNYKNIFFGDYDILYCCNIVFEFSENKYLFKKILKEFNGIFILFEFDNTLLPYLVKETTINTSWSKNVSIYIFKK